MTEVFWNRMTASELRDAAGRDAIVLLPVASTEQHGPHLATGVDAFLGTEICRRTAKRVSKERPVVVAPTVWMGLAEHHVGYGGTFSVSLATFHALLHDLCEAILRAGFKKILLTNSHGGNIPALLAMTTDLTRDLKTPIAMTTVYALPHDRGAFVPILEDQKGVLHACEAETSMMMAAFGDCVRSDKIVEAFGPTDVRSPTSQPLLVWKSFMDLTASGVLGDARRANRDKGDKLIAIATQLLADELLSGAPWQ